jgi:hypothetical protein
VSEGFQFAVTNGDGYTAFVRDAYSQKQLGESYKADDPWLALYALSHDLCRKCHFRERLEGEKYCKKCRGVVLADLSRNGYLQPVPKITVRQRPWLYKIVGDNVWDDVVNAYEHAGDERT